MFAHNFAKAIKNKGLSKKWYAVLWDAYVYNKPNRALDEIPRRKRTAQKVLNDADGLFMLDGIMEENIKNNYHPPYHNKTVNIHLPSLINRCEMRKTQNDKVNLVYTGAFYTDLRRPEDMMNVLSKFPTKYLLKIYGRGCEDILIEKAKLFRKDGVLLLGRVLYEESYEALANADILVNVGNTISNMIPSKVFEYMSFGKPIINFYSIEEDMGLKYLRKYPLCYNFNTTNYTQKDVEDLISFCEKNKDKRMTFEEVSKGLSEYTSQVVCQKVYSVIVETQE